MVGEIISLSLIMLLVLGPILWRVRRDRRQERALGVKAELQAAINHELEGESLLVVNVAPPTWLRPGRVLLSVPSGWEWLIEAVWRTVVSRVPDGYELVVTPHEGAWLLPSREPSLSRAA